MPLLDTQGNDSADAYGGGVAPVINYIENVFSTYLYTGTGSAQTITNNIDTSTYGGLTWIKSRSGATDHKLTDTVRGVTKALISDTTAAQTTDTTGLTAFGTTGFTVGANTDYNTSASTYVSWTLREKPKFFDVVTYTGTGSNTTIAHSLGSVPGSIIVKRTDTTAAWAVYHRSLANTQYLVLNTTAAAATGATWWNSTTPTSAVFSLGTDASVNASGGTYVAYIFAHDAGGFGLTGTDNVITCGSFTTDGSGNTTVSLGYEPQWVMYKASSTTGSWTIVDFMRGFPVNADGSPPTYQLFANSSSAENGSGGVGPTATGFAVKNGYLTPSSTYIYIAIRRGPMAVPTTGTSVFSPNISSGSTGTVITTNFPVDMQINSPRDISFDKSVVDRFRGVITTSTDTLATRLRTNLTNAESDNFYSRGWNNTGFQMPTTIADVSDVFWSFRRAPSFFDEVCYTGNGGINNVQNHALATSIGMLIVKRRDSTGNWSVFAQESGGNYSYWNSSGTGTGQGLNGTGAATGTNYSGFNTYLTSASFNAAQIAGSNDINANGGTYVAYLFATCPGVSKVGSYTGNGTTQAIACGFTGGARFVLIKRTDSTGDWYVYDTARGMTVLTDPYLLLNSTAAETATLGSVTTTTGGFTVNASILSAINTNSATYIFLAIA